MPDVYQSLYAYLAGRVDEVLCEMDEVIEKGPFDKGTFLVLYEVLKGALQSCEDRYLAATEPPAIQIVPKK